MDTAADWAAVSPIDSPAPVFGGRRQWLGYVYETTGFGSLEMSGASAHRVTIVRPGDAQALADHHRMVRAGRLVPTWPRRAPGPDRVHVLEHDELRRTRADAHDSWLVAARGVARLCGTDDEVAHLAGGPLRHVLWSGRHHLASLDVVGALVELRHAADELAVERTAYRAAVERLTRDGRRAPQDDPRPGVDELARRDLETIRLEIRALSAVRAEWDGVA
jgi:hypothetical protein